MDPPLVPLLVDCRMLTSLDRLVAAALRRASPGSAEARVDARPRRLDDATRRTTYTSSLARPCRAARCLSTKASKSLHSASARGRDYSLNISTTRRGPPHRRVRRLREASPHRSDVR